MGKFSIFPYFQVKMGCSYWHPYRDILGWLHICRGKSAFPQLCPRFDPQFSKFLTSSVPLLPSTSRWWVSWATPVPYPPSPSTTFPFPPYTAAWRAPTPSQLAAANALTPSRVWTAWLPPSHTAPRPTAPPATAWTPSPQATSTASMARVSKSYITFTRDHRADFQKPVKRCPVLSEESLLDLCTLLEETDTCSW